MSNAIEKNMVDHAKWQDEKIAELSEKLAKAIKALEEIANGHLQEQVSELIADNALEELK